MEPVATDLTGSARLRARVDAGRVGDLEVQEAGSRVIGV
jgi:hypothetical protein